MEARHDEITDALAGDRAFACVLDRFFEFDEQRVDLLVRDGPLLAGCLDRAKGLFTDIGLDTAVFFDHRKGKNFFFFVGREAVIAGHTASSTADAPAAIRQAAFENLRIVKITNRAVQGSSSGLVASMPASPLRIEWEPLGEVHDFASDLGQARSIP